MTDMTIQWDSRSPFLADQSEVVETEHVVIMFTGDGGVTWTHDEAQAERTYRRLLRMDRDKRGSRR